MTIEDKQPNTNIKIVVMQVKHHSRLGIWLALLGSIAFSGKAIIVKLAYRYGVDAMTLLMYRMLFALPFFAAIAWYAGRGKPRLSIQEWGYVFFLGLTGYYLASFLDFIGLQYISASLERLILYLNPTWVLLLAIFLYGRKVTRSQWMAMTLSYLGVCFVFGYELWHSGLSAKGGIVQGVTASTNAYKNIVWGSLAVLLSGVSYSLYLSQSGQWVKRLGPLRLVGLSCSVACLLCIAQFLLFKPLKNANVVQPILILSMINAVFCTVIPVFLVMFAIERIGASQTAQIGMIGPFSTIAMGVVILNEPFNVLLLVGTVFVVAGIYLFSKGSSATVDSTIHTKN